MCRKPTIWLLLFALFIMLAPTPVHARGGRLQGFISRINPFHRTNSAPAATASPSKPAVDAPAPKAAAPAPDFEKPKTPRKVEDVTLTPCEESMLDGLNKFRVSRGVQPVAPDAALMKSARAHAITMARQRSMYHGGFNGPETVAMNRTHAGETLRQWLSSPPHAGIMLSPYNKRVGLSGYANGGSFYVQQFSR